jgi:hypothetical protein
MFLSEIEKLLGNDGFRYLDMEAEFNKNECLFYIYLIAENIKQPEIRFKVSYTTNSLYEKDVSDVDVKRKKYLFSVGGVWFFGVFRKLYIENVDIIDDVSSKDSLGRNKDFLIRNLISDIIVKKYDMSEKSIKDLFLSRPDFEKELKFIAHKSYYKKGSEFKGASKKQIEYGSSMKSKKLILFDRLMSDLDVYKDERLKEYEVDLDIDDIYYRYNETKEYINIAYEKIKSAKEMILGNLEAKFWIELKVFDLFAIDKKYRNREKDVSNLPEFNRGYRTLVMNERYGHKLDRKAVFENVFDCASEWNLTDVEALKNMFSGKKD